LSSLEIFFLTSSICFVSLNVHHAKNLAWRYPFQFQVSNFNVLGSQELDPLVQTILVFSIHVVLTGSLNSHQNQIKFKKSFIS